MSRVNFPLSRNRMRVGIKKGSNMGLPRGTRSCVFDGSNERIVAVNIAESDNFEWQVDSFSVSCWFKTSTTGEQWLWSFGDDSSASTYVGVRVKQNESSFWATSDGGGGALFTGESPNTVSAQLKIANSDTNGINPSDDSWHHIVVTVKGAASTSKAVKFYIDGLEAGYGATTNNTLSPDIFNMGVLGRNDNSSLVQYFTGRMAQLTMYSRELTAGEIQAVYNGGHSLDETTFMPIHYYRFGNGDKDFPDSLTDFGTGKLDGTPVNMEAADIVEDHP